MKFLHRLALFASLIAAALAPLTKAVAAFTLIAAHNLFAASPFRQFQAPVALGANTLTNLIPDTYAALKVVSREIVGLIPGVNRDSTADRLAIGQTLRSTVAPVNTAGADITAAMAFPSAADQVIGNTSLTLTKARKFPFSWSGEDQLSVAQGPGLISINQQQIAQAIRAAIAELSADLYATMRKGASRATGTAGTTPFASTLDNAIDIGQILTDNGTAYGDRSLVINTTASTKLKKLTQLQKVNEGGGDSLLRQGILQDINGFAIREEAQIGVVTKGTAASATTNAAGYAVGATTLTLAAAGTGTILAGDCITFAGDTANIYVVKTGNADVSAGGTIVLNDPGLKVAMSTATKAITVGGNFTANLAFTRDFATLGTRLPAVPKEGDLAIMREIVTDPLSGISFELAVYPGYRMVTYEIALAWGSGVMNPEHGAILLG